MPNEMICGKLRSMTEEHHQQQRTDKKTHEELSPQIHVITRKNL